MKREQSKRTHRGRASPGGRSSGLAAEGRIKSFVFGDLPINLFSMVIVIRERVVDRRETEVGEGRMKHLRGVSVAQDIDHDGPDGDPRARDTGAAAADGRITRDMGMQHLRHEWQCIPIMDAEQAAATPNRRESWVAYSHRPFGVFPPPCLFATIGLASFPAFSLDLALSNKPSARMASDF